METEAEVGGREYGEGFDEDVCGGCVAGEMRVELIAVRVLLSRNESRRNISFLVRSLELRAAGGGWKEKKGERRENSDRANKIFCFMKQQASES